MVDNKAGRVDYAAGVLQGPLEDVDCDCQVNVNDAERVDSLRKPPFCPACSGDPSMLQSLVKDEAVFIYFTFDTRPTASTGFARVYLLNSLVTGELMSALYLTPASIGYLTQFILAAAIAGYFWHLARRSWPGENDALPTLLLAGALTSFACATLLLFLNISLYLDLGFYAMPLESVAVALFLVLLLQFAYRFPSPAPGQKWEARVVLGLTTLYALWEGNIAIQRYAALAQGDVRYRPAVADFPLAVAFLWVVVVFLRQTVRTSTGDGQENVAALQPPSLRQAQGRLSGASPRGRGSERMGRGSERMGRGSERMYVTAWRKLWQPHGRGARAARALALLSLMPLGLQVVELFKTYLVLPYDIAELVQSLGILFTLSAFALVYLNQLPEMTSLMVKLVGVTLAALLAILGSVGWIVSPAYVAAYHNDRFITDRQTLRFTPNAEGGYDVDGVPFRFEDDFGSDLGAGDGRVELPFDFLFFDQVWREAYVLDDGVVSFGQAFDRQDVKYRYGTRPAIFPLHLDLAVDANDPPGGAGLFARNTPEGLVVTWYQLPEAWDREARYTFQLVLYPGGVFDITYNDLPATQMPAIQEPRDAAWLIGAVSGSAELRPDHIRFTADLPYAGGARGGVVEDYYLSFRRYLHELFLPLAYVIIGSSVLIVVVFPLFFRLNLVRPLDSLLEGVRQINAGNLEVSMPVQYHDEIGFLTQSFNDMAAQLQSRTRASGRRAAELEALATVSSALRQAKTSADMIPILLEATVKALGAEAGAILLLEDGALVVTGHQGLPRTLLGQRFRPDDVPCWPALQAGQLARSDLVEQRICAACGLCQTLAQGMRTLAVVPLQTADQTLGLLQVAFHQTDGLLEEHRWPLMAIAEMAGNALQRARTMEMLEQLVEDRTRDLTALFAVSAVASHALGLETLLAESLSQTLEAMRSDAGAIYLLGETEGTAEPLSLRLAAQQGIPAEVLDQHGAFAAERGVFRWVMEHREPLLIPDVTADPHTRGMGARGPLALLLAPLLAEGQVLGVVGLVREAGPVYNADEVALLASIADQVGVAVQSDRLRQRAQQTVVLEERQRLARELHDAVTQTLFSAGLIAEALPRVWQRDAQAGRRGLEELRRLTQGASAEMRTLLLELRPRALTEKPLGDLLSHLVETMSSRIRVPINLAVDRGCLLPGDVQIALYRTAQEALNNVARHAEAGQVCVELSCAAQQVTLRIRDDGRGFDLADVLPDRLGMGTMRERAERIGAALEVKSRPGQGTEVVVVWTKDEGRKTG